jgi:hypothetical protein
MFSNSFARHWREGGTAPLARFETTQHERIFEYPPYAMRHAQLLRVFVVAVGTTLNSDLSSHPWESESIPAQRRLAQYVLLSIRYYNKYIATIPASSLQHPSDELTAAEISYSVGAYILKSRPSSPDCVIY